MATHQNKLDNLRRQADVMETRGFLRQAQELAEAVSEMGEDTQLNRHAVDVIYRDLEEKLEIHMYEFEPQLWWDRSRMARLVEAEIKRVNGVTHRRPSVDPALDGGRLI